MPEIHPALIALVLPAIIGLVNMLKSVGLPKPASGPVALILGIAGAVSWSLFGDLEVFQAALIGVLLGLGSAGFYDLSKLIGNPVVIDSDAPRATHPAGRDLTA